MKRTNRTLGMAAGLFLAPAGLWAQTPVPTKSHSTANQLVQYQAPKTESPATMVGGVPGVLAPEKGCVLVLQKGSFLFLAGDSSLHKFEIGANALFASTALKVSAASSKEEGGLQKALKAHLLVSMDLTVPVIYLKSKEKGLDENAYKALKEKVNPEIKFSMAKETLSIQKGTGKAIVTALGKLTIAGETVPVTLIADIGITGNHLRLTGVQKINMSDYKIKPPSISLLVTSINVADAIEVHYDLLFAPKD